MIKRFREWIAGVLVSNFTTTATAATSTPLAFNVKAGETWKVTVQATAQCSSTGGVKYAVAAPAGSTLEGWLYSSTSAVTTLSYQRLTAINTLTATATHTVATTPAPDRLEFTLVAGADGTVTIQAASGTSGQTTTLFANSSLVAQRVG